MNQSETFAYDSLGNRLSDQNGGFTYDNKSQRLIQDYKYDYHYDLNGNLTKKTERGFTGNLTNYAYSSENQLIKIEEFKNAVLVMRASYSYDALGRRIKKDVENYEDSAKSNIRQFVFDGNEILSELDGDNAALVVYTHSNLRTDDVLTADVRSTSIALIGSYSYLKDGLGSITDIVDSSGNLVQHYSYSYSSFGKLSAITNSSGTEVTNSEPFKNRFTYTNREWDEESGLYYYRARYYDANNGRFMQEDPLAGLTSHPSSVIQKYSYVLNNPMRYTDPSGKIAPIFAAMIVGALIGGSLNALLSKGNFFENFLIGAAAGAVAGAVGYGIGAAIGPTASFWGAVGKGALVGGAASGAATTTSLLLRGEDITSQRNLGKIGLSIVIGAIVGGAIGGLGYNSPKPVSKTLEKAVPVQGEVIDAGAQETYDYIFDIRAIECAPFINQPSSYQACMGQ